MNDQANEAQNNVSFVGRIDNYRLLKKLGNGANSVVYLVYDEIKRRNCALKTLPSSLFGNTEAMERLSATISKTSRLEHQNTATAYKLHKSNVVIYSDQSVRNDIQVRSGDTIMLMSYAPGETLDKWRQNFPNNKVPYPTALEVIRQIASALDYVHKNDILHLAIKPSNIMVNDLGDKIQVSVLDLGVSSEIHIFHKPTNDHSAFLYMAPEQLQGGRLDSRTDEYALACILYELISGEVPFAQTFKYGERRAITNDSPKDLEEVNSAVNAIIARALSKASNKRFAICSDFVVALENSQKSSSYSGSKRNSSEYEISHTDNSRGIGGMLRDMFVSLNGHIDRKASDLRSTKNKCYVIDITNIKEGCALDMSEPLTWINAKLHWHTPVDLDLHAFVRLTNGGEHHIYYGYRDDGYMSLDKDAGVGNKLDSPKGNEENIRCSTLSGIDRILFATKIYNENGCFSDYRGSVEVTTSNPRQAMINVNMKSRENKTWCVIAMLDNSNPRAPQVYPINCVIPHEPNVNDPQWRNVSK